VLAGHAQAALWHVVTVLASFLVMASIAIPLTREALDEGGEFVFAQFVLGARELRYFLALIRLGVIMIAVLAAGVFAAAGIPAAAKLLAAHWPGLQGQFDHWPIVHGVQISICALAFLTALIAALRFGFLLKAVAAVEHRASLSRAWALSRGNTVRILMVVVLAAIPAYVVLFAIAYAFLGQPLLDAYRDAFAAGAAKPGAALLALYAARGAAFACLAALKLLLLVGLMAGASAEAYRTLTADEDDGAAHEAAARHHEEPALAAQDAHHERHREEPAQEHGHEEHGHEDHGHEETGHDDQGHHHAAVEPALAAQEAEEPLTQDPVREDTVFQAEGDVAYETEGEPVPRAAIIEPPPQGYELQHDDDESCDCQIHATPVYVFDDPHDVHVIEPVLAVEPVRSSEGEDIQVLEPA
jgi:hypothetical protein